MSDVFVVNASPVIVLAKIGHLGLLTRLADRVLLPSAVADEILAGPDGDPARVAVASGWGERVDPVATEQRIIEWSLGAGESAVIATASQCRPAVAVLDDAQAGSCARTVGVPVKGTLGIVLRAKRQGVISAAAPLVHAIGDSGAYVSDAVARAALKAVGEPWP